MIVIASSAAESSLLGDMQRCSVLEDHGDAPSALKSGLSWCPVGRLSHHGLAPKHSRVSMKQIEE